jgi:hypothetical protein
MNKIAIHLLMLCLWTPPAGAQTTRYNLDFTLSKHDFADTIAIDFERNQVYVPIAVDGKRLRFLLDTGAGHSVIYTDTPIDNWKPAGTMASHDASEQTDTVQTVILPPIQLGTVVYTGCRATRQQRIVRRIDVDGILGFDFICKGLSVKIDTRKRCLILTDRKDLFNGEEGFSTRYRLRFHVPYVSISPFGKYREEARFDTGSPHFYMMGKRSFDQGTRKMPAILLDSLVEGRSQGHHVMGFGGTESVGEVVFLHLRHLNMAGLSFDDVHALTTQGISCLGAQLLAYGTLTIKPHQRRIIFQPYDHTDRVHVGNMLKPIYFVNHGGKPVVGLVWERGLPYQLGFREGDTFLEIDSRPIRDFHQFTRWAFEPGRTYRFKVISRDGHIKEIDWVRLP